MLQDQPCYTHWPADVSNALNVLDVPNLLAAEWTSHISQPTFTSLSACGQVATENLGRMYRYIRCADHSVPGSVGLRCD